MDHAISKLYGGARLALSAFLGVVPGAARPWIGAAAQDPDVRGPLRMLAVRDALLAAALLSALDHEDLHRRMLVLCAVADAADSVTAVADFVRTRRPGAALASAAAAGGMAVGAGAAASLGRPEESVHDG